MKHFPGRPLFRRSSVHPAASWRTSLLVLAMAVLVAVAAHLEGRPIAGPGGEGADPAGIIIRDR